MEPLTVEEESKLFKMNFEIEVPVYLFRQLPDRMYSQKLKLPILPDHSYLSVLNFGNYGSETFSGDCTERRDG